MKSKLMLLISILAIATMVLTACGAGKSNEPVTITLWE